MRYTRSSSRVSPRICSHSHYSVGGTILYLFNCCDQCWNCRNKREKKRLFIDQPQPYECRIVDEGLNWRLEGSVVCRVKHVKPLSTNKHTFEKLEFCISPCGSNLSNSFEFLHIGSGQGVSMCFWQYWHLWLLATRLSKKKYIFKN